MMHLAQPTNTKFHKIRHALTHHHHNVVEQFHKKHSATLTKAKKHTLTLAGAAILAAATIGGAQMHHVQVLEKAHKLERLTTHEFVKQIKNILKEKHKLNMGEEEVIAQALSKEFGIDLTAHLDGNRLNEIYGYMGAEQHLRRWAGDNLSQHDMQRSGIAPLQGAFKNFDNAEQEKYYVAVQLHELPTWNKNWSTLKPWYRYRKVFVFNPENQKGIIAVIGDAGPSKFTGKTFGGSPELMQHLNMVDGARKGKAIILFVDDPQNKIALGPVNSLNAQLLAENTK
jgi:hypothetical protein